MVCVGERRKRQRPRIRGRKRPQLPEKITPTEKERAVRVSLSGEGRCRQCNPSTSGGGIAKTYLPTILGWRKGGRFFANYLFLTGEGIKKERGAGRFPVSIEVKRKEKRVGSDDAC